MDGLTTTFIVIAGINALLNFIKLIVEEENKTTSFSATMGWACAILWAIM
tara:strand:+ start:16897 stop:17046 length:150 start_codon:yes stop_codon:yes gene_type:complete